MGGVEHEIVYVLGGRATSCDRRRILALPLPYHPGSTWQHKQHSIRTCSTCEYCTAASKSLTLHTKFVIRSDKCANSYV